MGFLLKILLIFFALVFFARIAFRALLPHLFNNAMQNFQQQQQKATEKKKEGEVSIIKEKKQEKTVKENVGDYTDFEEVD